MAARSKLLLLSVLAAVALVAALGWWQFGRSDDKASRVEIGSAQPFALVDCKARLFDGSPAVALMFSQPLARNQDWGQLLKASEGDKAQSSRPVAARWVLGDNPRVLYLPYVTPELNYHVEWSESMAAVGGATLGSAGVRACRVKFADYSRLGSARSIQTRHQAGATEQ